MSGQSNYILVPKRVTCSPSIASNDASDLVKLTACKDAMVCYSKLIDYNNEVIQYNKLQDAELQAAYNVWSAKEANYEQQLNDWKQMRNNYKKWGDRKTVLENETFTQDCPSFCNPLCVSGCSSHGCPSGYYEASREGCTYFCLNYLLAPIPFSGDKSVCKRTSAEVQRILNNEGYQAAKPSFTDPEPIQKSYPHLDQNNTAINLQCCSNYMNVTGNSSNNIQSCIQTIDQLQKSIENSSSTTSSTETTETETETSLKIPSEPIQPSSSIAISPDIIVYLILGILILFFISVCISSSYLFGNKKEKLPN
jgi:hypothetical protein